MCVPSTGTFHTDCQHGLRYRRCFTLVKFNTFGSRTCARSEIQAGAIVLFIRWRGGAARRRISFWGIDRGRRATGSTSPPAARTSKVARICSNLTMFLYPRARDRAARAALRIPAAPPISFLRIRVGGERW